MALEPGDTEKVPPDLTARDCYERIWSWHRTKGDAEASQQGLASDHLALYRSILVELPTETDATLEDRAFLFKEVLNGSFEWSYQIEDDHGIKIAAYAFRGLELQHGGEMPALNDAAAESLLSRLKG